MDSSGGINIREATRDDLPGIFKIYNYEILNSTSTFDTIPKTTAEEHHEFFNQFDKTIYPLFVAEKTASQEIVGWARLLPWSSKPSYSITSDFSIYVDRENKRNGVGRLLLSKLIQHAKTVAVQNLIAVISDENSASVQFHEAAGFETVGLLKNVGYKFGRLLHVRLMQLTL